MKFFIAKLYYAGGDTSHPISLFSESMATAMDRLKGGLGPDEVSQIIIRERPMAEAAVIYSRNKEGPAVVEHQDIHWESEI